MEEERNLFEKCQGYNNKGVSDRDSYLNIDQQFKYDDLLNLELIHGYERFISRKFTKIPKAVMSQSFWVIMLIWQRGSKKYRSQFLKNFEGLQLETLQLWNQSKQAGIQLGALSRDIYHLLSNKLSRLELKKFLIPSKVLLKILQSWSQTYQLKFYTCKFEGYLPFYKLKGDIDIYEICIEYCETQDGGMIRYFENFIDALLNIIAKSTLKDHLRRFYLADPLPPDNIPRLQSYRADLNLDHVEFIYDSYDQMESKSLYPDGVYY